MSLGRFFRRARWDEERARELEAHLAIEIDDNIARGMSAADARDAARRKLGNTTLVREEIFQMNTLALLDSAWRDVKYGARLLRLNPGFAVVAILSLALGIGANTAIFQLLDAVRLRTLPVANPQEIVDLRINTSGKGRTGRFLGRASFFSDPLFKQIAERQQAFSGLAAWGTSTFNLTSSGEAKFARGMWVNGDYFSTLGVSPFMGRLLTAADDVRGCSAPPAVVSYGFWQRDLGGDASVLARQLTLEGHGFQIVGVTPPQFFGTEVGRSFDVAIPICAEPLTRVQSALGQPDTWFLGIFGRLKPGWTLERARAQVNSFASTMFHETLPPRYRPEDAKTYLAFRIDGDGRRHGDVDAAARLRSAALAAPGDDRPRAGDRVREPRQPDAGARQHPRA